MRTIGEVIKEFRQANNFSLRELAKMTGLSHTYIDKLEKGYDPRTGKKVEPTMDTIVRIAKAMNMPTESLLKEIGYIDNNADSIPDRPWQPVITPKDERDIAKDLERIMTDLSQADGLMFYNEPIDDEDKELLRQAIEFGLHVVKRKNKAKYTPKKYRRNKGV